MTYSKEVIDQCFQYYLQGKTLHWIEHNYKKSPPRATLSDWKKRYNWKEKRKEITKKAEDIIGENLAEVKARQLKVIKASIMNYVKAMKDGEVKVNPKDIVNLMKHELLLLGESTENININMSIEQRLKQAYAEVGELDWEKVKHQYK